MKKSELKIGSHYVIKLRGSFVTVLLVAEKVQRSSTGKRMTHFIVNNLRTGREIIIKSALRFLREVDLRFLVKTPKEERTESNPSLADSLSKTLGRSSEVKSPPHLIVQALAGTGKTTTLVEGLRIIKTGRSMFTPSPQQAEVWKAMARSSDASTICFVAFNKSIARELEERVPKGCNAMTMHSMGYRTVRNTFFGLKAPNSYRVQDTIAEMLEMRIQDIRKYKPEVLKATERLVSLCKMNLVGMTKEGFQSSSILREDLVQLTSHYDVDLNGGQREVFDLIPKVLERCLDVQADGCVDFDDMIWLPIALNLSVFRYDLLLVDEAQDLNRCQQALAKKASRRLIFCGDSKQAIYGFAGADAESMSRLQSELEETPQSCEVLPLTVTRRCGKAIVEEARKYVPEFEAHERNPKGAITRANFKGPDKNVFPIVIDDGEPVSERDDFKKVNYRGWVENGDMILCRVNAPLVSECFKFLRAGRKANIQGRDVGQGLISTINKMKATDITNLVSKLSDWLNNETRKENAKRNPSESRLIALQDRHDCIVCFTENQATVEDVIKKIEDVFTDDRNGAGIKLSSVHKAKGLEANRVFIIQPEGATMPHPMAKTAWQKEQEFNLLYVAITRAIEELVYVS